MRGLVRGRPCWASAAFWPRCLEGVSCVSLTARWPCGNTPISMTPRYRRALSVRWLSWRRLLLAFPQYLDAAATEHSPVSIGWVLSSRGVPHSANFRSRRPPTFSHPLPPPSHRPHHHPPATPGLEPEQSPPPSASSSRPGELRSTWGSGSRRSRHCVLQRRPLWPSRSPFCGQPRRSLELNRGLRARRRRCRSQLHVAAASSPNRLER